MSESSKPIYGILSFIGKAGPPLYRRTGETKPLPQKHAFYLKKNGFSHQFLIGFSLYSWLK